MGTAFRGFITVGRLYQTDPSSENIEQVLRQLDVLMGQTSSATDLQFFDPRDLSIAESLTIMVDLLLEKHPEIVKKLLFLLQNLGHSPRLQEYLSCQLHLHSSLAVFLQTCALPSKDQIVIQCFRLLELYTYHAVVPTVESSMEFVLQAVFKEIQNNYSDAFMPCMGLLSNLSRNSPAIVSYIRSLPDAVRITKTLIEKLSCNLQPAFLHSMITLFVILKGDPIRNGIFSSRNTSLALEMAINIFSNEDLSTQRTAADLICALLTCPDCHNQILQSKRLEKLLCSIWLALIKTKSSHSASNLMNLLLSLCSYPALQGQLINSMEELSDEGVLKCLQEWALCSASPDDVQQADVFAWQLLNIIILDICHEEKVLQYKPFISTILKNALPVHLKSDINFQSPDLKLQLLKVSNILTFLLVFSEKKDTQIFLKAFIPELCRYVIASQVENHSSIADEDCINSSLDIVILTLSIMKNLVDNFKGIKELFVELLQGNALVIFLANSLLLKTEVKVRRALDVIFCANNISDFSSNVLAEVLSSRNQLSQTTFSNKSASAEESVKTVISMIPPQRKRRESLDNSIQVLISKLEKGLEIKDLESSEIMEMYENKVDVLSRQIQELEKVLETKTVALQQSDKFLSHYRCVHGQHEAEVLKLRNLLKDSERKSELAKEQTREVTTAQDRMKTEFKKTTSDLETLHQEYEELNECKLEISQRLKSTQQQLKELQSNNDSLKEMNAVLQKHSDNIQQKHEAMSLELQDITNEKRTLSKQVKERDQKIKDLSVNLDTCEGDLKKKAQALAVAEKSNTQLKEKLLAVEKSENELRLEVSSLRKLCSQHEKALLEKAQELRLLNEKLAEQQKVTDGIMNLLNQGSRK